MADNMIYGGPKQVRDGDIPLVITPPDHAIQGPLWTPKGIRLTRPLDNVWRFYLADEARTRYGVSVDEVQFNAPLYALRLGDARLTRKQLVEMNALAVEDLAGMELRLEEDGAPLIVVAYRKWTFLDGRVAYVTRTTPFDWDAM